MSQTSPRRVLLLIELDQGPTGHTLDYTISGAGGAARQRRAIQPDRPGRGGAALTRWLLRGAAVDEAGAAQGVWSEARTLAGPGGVVDLRLRCRGGHLAELPWERMAHPETQVELALDPGHTFARWTPGPARPAFPSVELEGAGIVADAVPGAPIAEDFGRSALEGACRAGLAWHAPGTVAAWRGALRAAPDVLLLMSHGGPLAPEAGGGPDQPWAVYLDGEPGVRRYSLDDLVADVSQVKAPPALLCVTACGGANRPGSGFTDLGARLVAAGVGAALVMTGTAPQPTVEAFLGAFLDGVRRHGDLATAARDARQALRDREVPGGWIPVLHVGQPAARLERPATVATAAPEGRPSRARLWIAGAVGVALAAGGVGALWSPAGDGEDGAPQSPRSAVDAGPADAPRPATAHRPALLPVPTTPPLWAMRTEVTRAQYQAVVGPPPPTTGCAQPACPVVDVTWHQALRYANRLSTLEGATPCYAIDPAGALLRADCEGYRLPTLPEGQALARAGRPALPAGAERVAEAALAGSGVGAAQAVGGRQANPWGLHDVLGNVAEWAWAERGAERPTLGGSWRSPASQVGRAGALQLEDHVDDVGLRLVRRRAQ